MMRTQRIARVAVWAALFASSVYLTGALAAPSSASDAELRKTKRKSKTKIDVLFSPDGGIADRIIREIDRAKSKIRVQAYFFTSKPIGDALAEAKKRGVDVVVIMDGSQKKGRWSRWRVMRRDGIPIYFDDEHATANNKIILIDNDTIITGSYNFTKAAEERNAENVLIIKNDKRLFKKYVDNFDAHLEHSKKYTG